MGHNITALGKGNGHERSLPLRFLHDMEQLGGVEEVVAMQLWQLVSLGEYAYLILAHACLLTLYTRGICAVAS